MRYPGIAILSAIFVLSACSTSPASPPLPSATDAVRPSVPAPSSAEPAASDPWSEDLDQLDAFVRANHPDPFAINPESAWTAKLAELRRTLATATPDEQLVQLASLIGLLDTHSWLGPAGILHAYEAVFYRFSDGWFAIRTADPSLRAWLVSIGGLPIDDAEAMWPIVPSSGESRRVDRLVRSYVAHVMTPKAAPSSSARIQSPPLRLGPTASRIRPATHSRWQRLARRTADRTRRERTHLARVEAAGDFAERDPVLAAV